MHLCISTSLLAQPFVTPVHYRCYNFAPISILLTSVTSNVPVFKGSVNEHVLLNLDSGVCVCCHQRCQPLLAKEEEGIWLSELVFYVSPVCRCSWRQNLVCVTGCVSVLCVCVCMCASRIQIDWTCKQESSSCIPWPGRQTPGHAGLGSAAGRSNPWAPRCWRWQPLITSLSIYYV